MTPITPEEMLGERIGGRFVIERLIGDGPISSAYRAQDSLLSRRVTVKLFHPSHPDDASVVESQLALAHAVARLSHPNIITVIDRGEHDGMPFIVLEHVRGESLEERIDRYAPLEIDDVSDAVEAVAKALAYAHAQDVVHGNVRPRNVLVSLDREVKLVDFGGGSYLATLGEDRYRLPDGSADGGPPAVTPEHDLFALGCLMLEALTGEPPAADLDPGYVQMLRPDMSPGLAGVVSRLLSTDPARQYASAHEAAAALSGARGRGSGGAAHAPAAGVGAAVTGPMEQVPGTPAGGDGQHTAVLAAPQPLVGGVDRARHHRRSRRARVVAWGAVIGPVVALAVFVVLLGGEFGGDQQRASDGPAAADAAIPVAAVRAFDPPPGDGSENDASIGNISDGDPSTSWETESYDTAELGGLKDGVGALLELEDPAAVAEFRLLTDLPGWRVQIFGGPAGGEKLSDFTSVSAEVEASDEDGEYPVDTGGEEYEAYVVWISLLAEDVDRHRARISELALRAAES